MDKENTLRILKASRDGMNTLIELIEDCGKVIEILLPEGDANITEEEKVFCKKTLGDIKKYLIFNEI